MTASPLSFLSPFTQSIGRFIYEPATNWQGAFSPSVVFNNNPQDAPIEAHVLAKVGSYGKQLGVMIRVLDLLTDGLDPAGLGKEQGEALTDFRELRNDATKAAEEFRRKVSADDILDLAKAFSEHRTPYEKQSLRDALDKTLKT